MRGRMGIFKTYLVMNLVFGAYGETSEGVHGSVEAPEHWPKKRQPRGRSRTCPNNQLFEAKNIRSPNEGKCWLPLGEDGGRGDWPGWRRAQWDWEAQWMERITGQRLLRRGEFMG